MHYFTSMHQVSADEQPLMSNYADFVLCLYSMRMYALFSRDLFYKV